MEAGSDEAQAMAGRVLAGRYRLARPLGQGGMGVVYEATQESLGRPVAVKVIRAGLVTDVEAVTRFRAEAERAGRLNHPHIVQIFDFGAEPGGLAWIAMERLSGEALSARIARGPMDERDVVRVGLEALAALEAAHAIRLVHRDLKPDNIFLTEVAGIGASVKLLDFGIAKLLEGDAAQKLTATGMLVGTPLYMSPEQARGADVDERADLYSLGAVLYEALTGSPPLSGANYNALLYAILSETPQPIAEARPDLSPALAAVVDRALAKEPGDRFDNAHAMAEALAQAGGVTMRMAPSAAASGVVPSGATPGAVAFAPTMATPHPDISGSRADEARSEDSGKRHAGWLVVGALAALALAALGLFLTRDTHELDEAPMVPARSAVPASNVSASTDATRDGAPHADAGRAEATPAVPVPTASDAAAATKRPRAKQRSARRRPAPRRVLVRYSGGLFTPYSQESMRAASSAFRGARDWSRCWPRGVPAPTVSTGREFLVDVAPDGRILAARPRRATDEPAAFARCMVPLLESITLPPTPTEEPATIRVSFGTSPIGPRR